MIYPKFTFAALVLPALMGTNSLDAKVLTVSMGKDLYKLFQAQVEVSHQILDQTENVVLMKLDELHVPSLSHIAHHNLKRCGGFFIEEEGKNNLQFLNVAPQKSVPAGIYDIDQQAIVGQVLDEIDENLIRKSTQNLAGFQNRKYNTAEGVHSQEWLIEQWQSQIIGLDYAQVEKIPHKSWLQPSVKLTLKGKSIPSEIVIIGGHGDSIAQGAVAPGADDNASGIAAILEISRAILASGQRFDRTIEFYSYAAEEAGLRGSSEIAQNYKSANIDVIGVMQLDMTNFRGSPFDLVLMSDYTSPEQNKFVESLLSVYLSEIKYSYDKCGYGCSDHASWNRQGYRASIPFEATLKTKNPYIHTAKDTLANSNIDPLYAKNFARIGAAYLIEMAN